MHKVYNIYILSFHDPRRFVRREKEIAETKGELSQSESMRYQQRCEYLEKQLEDAKKSLSVEKSQSQVDVQTAAQHADIMEKVEKLNELTESNKVLVDEKQKLEQKIKGFETKVRCTVECRLFIL